MGLATLGLRTPMSWTYASELIHTHTKEVVSSSICAAPLVSVCVMTYNHRPYVGQALDSILRQATDFAFEVVVGDDHSLDGTTDIVLDYQRRHPERIRVLLADENLGRYTGNGRLNLIRVLLACRGTYVAFLEGDDFWTGAERLSWGVAFLKENRQFNVVFHNIQIEYPDGQSKDYYTVKEWSNPQLPMPRIFTDFTDILHGAFIHVSTVIARYRPLDERQLELFVKLNFGDYFLMLVLSENGQLYFQDIFHGCYRFHGKGVFSSFSTKTNWVRYVEDKKRISLFYREACPEVAEKNLKGILERPWARDTGVNDGVQSFGSNWRETIRRKVYAYTRSSTPCIGAILDAVDILCDCGIGGEVVALCDDAGGEMMAIALGFIGRGEHDRTLNLVLVDCQIGSHHGPIAAEDRDATPIRLAVMSTGYPERLLLIHRATGTPPNVAEGVGLLLLPEPAENVSAIWLNAMLLRLVNGGIVITGERVWRREPQESVGAFSRRLAANVDLRSGVQATEHPPM